MGDVALGTKLFSRVDRLESLLQSIPGDTVSTAYVAHDGEWTDRKRDVLNAEYAVDLEVLDLEYDAGVGAGKNAIVDAITEQFLLMVDTDHRVPETVSILLEQLQARDDIGGIAGTIVEPSHGRVWQSAKDLSEEGGGLVRDAAGDRPMEMVAGSPLVTFDFVPAAILLRADCLADYRWDENYTVGSEHLDFHVGHWKQTDWKFAINPSVLFEHYPGGSAEYVSSRHGENVDIGREYFRSKWDYEYVRDKQAYWFDTASKDLTTSVRRAVSRHMPATAYKYGKRVFDSLQ